MGLYPSVKNKLHPLIRERRWRWFCGTLHTRKVTRSSRTVFAHNLGATRKCT